MRAQIYGILGLMYTLAIGILLVVALVGTSKQFTWHSSAPMYKLAMSELSVDVQRVRTFLSQERVYAADKALFYTGAFGGYSTFHDLVPKLDAKVCGCPPGAKEVNVNNNPCSASDTKCYCNESGKLVEPNMCFVSGNKRLDVGIINSSLWNVFPEKYFVYWYNKTPDIPSEEKIKNTSEEYMDYLFPLPDPRISIPLELLGVQMDFSYVTKIVNFSNDYVDIEWIPIGENSIILNFPLNHPIVNYMMKVAMRTKIRNNLFGLYKFSSNFVKNEKFNIIFDDVSKGILPTVIDENYVINYTKKDIGSYYCNYSTSDRPQTKYVCSMKKVNVNNLKPMVALVYYVDKYYWDSNPGSAYYTPKMGNGCGSCKKPTNYLSLSETDLNKSLPCTAEINSTIKNGIVQFRIDKFYGCENNNNLNTNLTCMMCAIVSKMNKDVGGSKVDITTSTSTWKYENSLSNEDYAIKMLPLEKFNITLNNVEVKTHNWTYTSFAANVTPPYNYWMKGEGCNNIVNGGQAGADSICEINGFQKAENCYSKSPVNPVKWGYNVTGLRQITCKSGYRKIDKVTCGNGVINLNSDYGFSVCGKLTGSGWISGELFNKLKQDPEDGPIIQNLSYACEVKGKTLTGILVKKMSTSNHTSPYLYLGGSTSPMNVGGDYGTIVNITCNSSSGSHTSNLKSPLIDSSENKTLGVDYSGLNGNFSSTSSFSKIETIYDGKGYDFASVYCKLKYGKDWSPKSMWVTNDTSYNNYKTYPGKLNLNVSSGGTTYNYAIEALNCSGTTLYCSNYERCGSTYSTGVGFTDVVGIKLDEVPFSMVSIYQPDNFANQREIFRRICPNKDLLAVHFNDSAKAPYLIIDTGKNGGSLGTITDNDYQLDKITCVIK